MKFDKFYASAKENNVSPLEVVYSSSKSLSVQVFNDTVEEYKESNDSSITLRGIYDGKLGTVSADNASPKMADEYIKTLVTSAKFGLPGDPSLFITKGQKYKKEHKLNEACANYPGKDMIADTMYISKKTRELEPRIALAFVGIDKSVSSEEFTNSNGLKLSGKGAHMVLFAQTKIVDGDKVETDFKFDVIEDPATFDKDKFVDELVKSSVSRLGGESIKSKKYNVVFSQKAVAQLIRPLVSQLSAFSVKQHLSLFENKLGEKVLSSKLTITENPHANNPFASRFDREGMPTVKKVLIKNGVPTTYLYDLQSAKEAGCTSTGNAGMQGGNIRPSLGFIEIKEGKYSFDDLLANVKNGVYIDTLEGIGTGYNTQSGDYSLQADGYEIKDGKLGNPVTLITVAGNVLKDFSKIIAVGNDSKLYFNSVSSPSIAIRSLSISGK